MFLFDNVIYKRSAHVHIWLTDDNVRMPVQIQVRLQFAIGTITLRLAKEERSRYEFLLVLVLASSLPAQTAAQALLSQKDAEQLTTRMVQLIESTAFAVPGLTRASEPVKQKTRS